MIALICACKNTYGMGSQPWPKCSPCLDCGTVPSPLGAMPYKPEPHDFVTTTQTDNAGTSMETHCRRCGLQLEAPLPEPPEVNP